MTKNFQNPEFNLLEDGRFKKPEFNLLEDDDQLKYGLLITEILRRFSTGEKVTYISGWHCMDNQLREAYYDQYDLLGIWSEENGWEVIPVPVFGDVFPPATKWSIKGNLIKYCTHEIERLDWEDSESQRNA